MVTDQTRTISFGSQTWEEQLKIVLDSMRLMPTLVTKSHVNKRLRDLGYGGKNFETYVSRSINRLVHIELLKEWKSEENKCSHCGHFLLKRQYYCFKEVKPSWPSSQIKTFSGPPKKENSD